MRHTDCDAFAEMGLAGTLGGELVSGGESGGGVLQGSERNALPVPLWRKLSKLGAVGWTQQQDCSVMIGGRRRGLGARVTGRVIYRQSNQKAPEKTSVPGVWTRSGGGWSR